jgi:hypothetical protein
VAEYNKENRGMNSGGFSVIETNKDLKVVLK